MKSILKSIHHKSYSLFLLFSISFLLIGCNGSSSENLENIISKDFGPEKVFGFKDEVIMTTGNFLLKNDIDGQPISNYMIYLVDNKTGGLVASTKSNPSGNTVIDGLINGKEYIIKVAPMATSWASISNKEGKSYIHDSTNTFFQIETQIERNANHIDVPTVMQYPELPNGCEITSLTAVLNYYGINVSKTTMADVYLPQVAFSFQNGKRNGPNPHTAFAGNPRDLRGGWYVYANPIVRAAKDVFVSFEIDLKAENVSGSTREEILSYIDQDIPVIVWVTIDLSPPIKRGGWYIEGTNEFHESFTNLHVVVLEGWEDGKLHIMNPLKGQEIISEDVFFDSYEALGSQAVIIKN